MRARDCCRFNGSCRFFFFFFFLFFTLFAMAHFALRATVEIQFRDAFCSAVVPNFTRRILFFRNAQVSSSSTMRDSAVTANILHLDKNRGETGK